MRLRFLTLSLVLVLCAGTGYAQTFTGLVDGYWSYNSNTPNNPVGNRFNPYRAFDIRDQSFALNYGEIAVDYKPNNVGIHVDVGFGDAADIVNASGSSTWRHIQQAYVTGTKDKFTIDFGKFVTPFGAEVIETPSNWNYTRGLLFTWAIPFTHLGARTTYAPNDKVSLAGYLVNGWDNVVDNNTAKSVGFSGNFKPYKKLNLVTNFMWGKEDPNTNNGRQLYEGILTYPISDKFSLMADYNYGQDKGPDLLPGVSGPLVIWQGVAGYAKYALPHATLAARYEWFQDRNGYRTGTAQELQSATGTVTFPIMTDLNVWGEYRMDWSNQSSFPKTSQGVFGPVQGLDDHQNTFLIGVTYNFTKMVK
jgi:Putative beta-barrel porin-2, OmpL-like. bbp2